MTEWDATGYSEVSSLQRWLADQHLAMLELDGTERVLDIGCGDGRITAEIARRLESGSVLGIDPSTHMIDFAKAHSEPAYPNLAFALGDATALPYRGEFDVVVSFNALHWSSTSARRCAASARRSSRPAGRSSSSCREGRASRSRT
jgi:trans-aconitate 2-methyltransferase